MQLIKTKNKCRCEMGSCRNKAEYTIKLDRAGIRSAIDICGDCLRELYKLLGGQIVPKSIETVKVRKEGGND